MITPDYQQQELKKIWLLAMELHKAAKLGSPVTPSLQRQMVQIAEDIFAVKEELARCEVFVPQLAVPAPTTNPGGYA